MPDLHYDHLKISYTVVYSKRKTIAIRVDTAGAVSVRAPRGISQARLQAALHAKAAWIIKMQETMKSRAEMAVLRIQDGETIPFRGDCLPVIVDQSVHAKRISVTLAAGGIRFATPDLEDIHLEGALEKWYRAQAEIVVNQLVHAWQPLVGKAPNCLQIRSQKKRWGSCTSQGKILINWRVILLPPDVAEYVIVHELCHLHHLNHSSDFWESVRRVMPDYMMRRKWLRQNGNGFIQMLQQ